MSKTWWNGVLLFSWLPALLVALGGCSLEVPKEQAKAKATDTAAKSDDSETWWCREHGIPEDICGQCNANVAAEFTKKGDWCKEHDRPESQCFICQPELQEKFAARYRAKYDKEPPLIEDELE